MRSLCIFCGSSVGSDPAYAKTTKDLASQLVRRNIGLVYGGGSVGLMGVLADAMLSSGGRVTGVIPRSLLDREVGHRGVTQLHVVETMHERKAMMAEASDAFLALPGGIGTLEELFEAWTWGQLGIHAKPVGVLNMLGYYDPLLEFLGRAVTEKFLRKENLDMLLVDRDAGALLDRMSSYRPPMVEKWLKKDEI